MSNRRHLAGVRSRRQSLNLNQLGLSHGLLGKPQGMRSIPVLNWSARQDRRVGLAPVGRPRRLATRRKPAPNLPSTRSNPCSLSALSSGRVVRLRKHRPRTAAEFCAFFGAFASVASNSSENASVAGPNAGTLRVVDNRTCSQHAAGSCLALTTAVIVRKPSTLAAVYGTRRRKRLVLRGRSDSSSRGGQRKAC